MILTAAIGIAFGAPLTPDNSLWNLNRNPNSQDPTQYYGNYPGRKYQPSPSNWRFPYYTIMVDRFNNGDPKNDDINKTPFEADMHETNLRFGGDAEGIRLRLPYLQSLGIKGIYIAGTILENFDFDYHGYNVKDQTLLDKHFGTIDDWRKTIEEIHARGMYIVVDLTLGTMTDLLGFEGHLNESTPYC